ncbi:MAG: hypothetical protein LQ342_003677 [Letrouitia transgressa]|nr:MAG: hypothetical protein LQ342_003677 [Letrouitia transgressa]
MAVDEQYLNEYEGDKLIAICALFIILETTFVALRYYARHLTPAGLGWDDAIIPVAWLTNIGLCILCINAVHHAGVGRHLAYVLKYHPTQFESWGKSLYALEWLYLTSVALPKLSVLCFFLRVFTRRDARLTCYVLIGFVTATWAAYILAANLKCRPLAYQWDKHIPGGYCANIEAYYKTTSVPNIVTDLVIIMLPVPTVIALKTTLVRKVGLLCVFLVGSV